MTICLRHDCILTERDERVGVKGHGRAPARTQQHVDKSAWCVGRANTHDKYVSFYKQDGTLCRFFVDYFVLGISSCCIYQGSYARKNSIIFIHENLTAATVSGCIIIYF